MSRLILAVVVILSCTNAFLTPTSPHTPSGSRRNVDLSSTSLHAGTNEKPLYDGTNYTFPDTTTPAGIAELLEVSFVNACMQLRTGLVDVLKMFIAASIAGYELGFSIDEIEKELAICPTNTANRPMMQEEIDLRRTWNSVTYLTLAAVDHPTRVPAVFGSIPSEVQDAYKEAVGFVVTAHKNGEVVALETLVENLDSDLSPMEKAIRSQSLRVIVLTLVVLRESMESRVGSAPPPTPPIEGAF